MIKMNREIIEQMKSQINGSFSNKEMLIYLMSKIEKIEDKVNDLATNIRSQFVSCTRSFISRKTFYWTMGIILTMITVIIGSLISL